MSSLSSFLFGQPERIQQVSRLAPTQQGAFEKFGGALGQSEMPTSLAQSPLYQSGSNYLQNLYSQSPDAFERFKAPYMRQFQQEVIPGIASRFAGMGTGGGLSSSGFQQALARAGEGLSTNLASQLEGMKMNLLPQLMGFAQSPMNQYQNLFASLMGISPFENIFRPATQGFLQQALSSGLQGLGMGTGMGFGNFLGN